MSTTFDVYPTSRRIPTFGRVKNDCRRQFDQFLAEVGLSTEASIFFQLRKNSDDEIVTISDDSEFRWSRNYYLWVGIEGIAGGTDGYFWRYEKWDYEYLRDDIIPSVKSAPIRKELRFALQVDHRWHFRRSWGQPGVVNILYGLLAGSIGTLTNGFIYSDDCAWDYQRMPIRAKDFLTIYFRPDKETNTREKEWAIQSIECARDELASLKKSVSKRTVWKIFR